MHAQYVPPQYTVLGAAVRFKKIEIVEYLLKNAEALNLLIDKVFLDPPLLSKQMALNCTGRIQSTAIFALGRLS